MNGILLIGATLLALAASQAAQDPVKNVPVEFSKGASSITVKDSVRGYATVNYTVAARAGQTIMVRMNTNNGSSYFNVTAPGADDALFNGSIAGNSFTGKLPSTGNYTVQVYLMRNAARRNEVANYTLTLGLR
ncbi:hypothetical protein ASE70_18745 [Sphingomonas sp. Leaf22]|uniref:hypothetical protein n=1 Tax=Sphingomonas sp. Leaf22 TaxID=1735687 RepID=UPI0007015469|nr:hypothetical protein [Sphingomonas sp. Leaf22]KQM79619.1 hypothetical protein ASE70_18745 [Sphingomonas sp. Leaf22]